LSWAYISPIILAASSGEFLKAILKISIQLELFFFLTFSICFIIFRYWLF
jgi:hypothetical protein